MKTVAERLADRQDPRYARPANWDAIVKAAEQAARAAREAGAPYDVVKRSALDAGYREAGLRPRVEDPWAGRRDLNDADRDT